MFCAKFINFYFKCFFIQNDIIYFDFTYENKIIIVF